MNTKKTYTLVIAVGAAIAANSARLFERWVWNLILVVEKCS